MACLVVRGNVSIVLPRWQAQRVGGEYFSSLLELDLVKFPVPSLPMEALRNLVFSSLSVVGKELSAVTEIERAHAGLAHAMSQRDSFIDRVSSGQIADTKHLLYLGMSLPDGRTDTTYPDLINAIAEYTDDLAFFSVTFC